MLVEPKVSLLDRCISSKSYNNRIATNNTSCICIPRLDVTITKKYVLDIIKKLNWGKIISISCVVNKKSVSTPFVSIFIDIEWFQTSNISNIRKIMSEGHAVKVVLNKFVVWKIYEKKNNTHIHN